MREQVAERAAQLMYFDGVKEYLRAKRKAAQELGVSVFPHNLEVRDALDRIADREEGPGRTDRLLAMRRAALEVMIVLEAFHPRLIGSVLTGHIKRDSDIDLHVFCDDHDRVGEALLGAGYEVASEVVSVKKGGELRDFPHYYLELTVGEVDISVYREEELKRPQKSSITHRTMERASMGRLRQIIDGVDQEDETA